MASRRVQSLPGDSGVNPFWSWRVREEARLRSLRPAALQAAETRDEEAVQRPVPGEDEEVRMELEEGAIPIESGIWKTRIN